MIHIEKCISAPQIGISAQFKALPPHKVKKLNLSNLINIKWFSSHNIKENVCFF